MKIISPDCAILLVDDEPNILLSIKTTLEMAGALNVYTLSNGEQVLPYLAEQKIDIIILDYLMPGKNGIATLVDIKCEYPEIAVIMATALNELNIAVKCMQAGAQDFLVKPINKEQLLCAINKALEFEALQGEVANLRKQLFRRGPSVQRQFNQIISRDPKMQAIFGYVEAVANSQEPILITGETGTGKELLSKAVHECSNRIGSFVAVNTAGLDDNMFSDTLFGHAKGAYTGALQDRKGLIDKAENGTLFLDEVGCLSERCQIKLLRVIQEKAYLPLGSDDLKATNARIVCAANCDLHEEIRQGRFRKDLYYRLRTHAVEIPPLRERMSDLPLLVDHFLGKSATILKKKKPTLPPEVFTLLGTYDFPGNIRELEGMIHNAVSLHTKGKLSLASFKQLIFSKDLLGVMGKEHFAVAGIEDVFPGFTGKMPTLKEAEEILIETALARAHDNQGIAARFLGISRQALNRRLVRKGRKC